jgi:hypothetical protein
MTNSYAEFKPDTDKKKTHQDDSQDNFQGNTIENYRHYPYRHHHSYRHHDYYYGGSTMSMQLLLILFSIIVLFTAIMMVGLSSK